MKEAVRNERKELGNEEEATGCVWKDFLEPFPSLCSCSRQLKIVTYSPH